MSEAKITAFNDEGDEVSIPAKWEICWRCRGNGSHTNPNIDGNGLPEEYAQDPDFMEEYLTGMYDVSCECCGGGGMVPVPDEDRCTPEQLRWYDDQQNGLADMRAMEEAERRAGC